MGALAFADDIVLVAPTASALRRMLVICDEYADNFCILLNAQKSKCLAVLPSLRCCLRDSIYKCEFTSGKKPIEFVHSYSHLGHNYHPLSETEEC